MGRRPDERPGWRQSLKWLALLALIPAGPLLLFGLTWGAPGLVAGGVAFVGAAAIVWRVLAQEWPVRRGR